MLRKITKIIRVYLVPSNTRCEERREAIVFTGYVIAAKPPDFVADQAAACQQTKNFRSRT